MRNKGKRWTRVATAAVIAGAVAPGVMRWVRRTGARKRSVDMQMTVAVDRPIHEVFEFCRDFENFPEVVDLHLKVDDFQDGRSHWTVHSPSGQEIAWDATVTKYVPNSIIAWESVPAAPVHAGGLMRFSPLSPTETRVDITLTYQPRETALGEAIRAMVAGSNTKRIRQELNRASHDMARPAVTSNALGPAA